MKNLIFKKVIIILVKFFIKKSKDLNSEEFSIKKTWSILVKIIQLKSEVNIRISSSLKKNLFLGLIRGSIF